MVRKPTNPSKPPTSCRFASATPKAYLPPPEARPKLAGIPLGRPFASTEATHVIRSIQSPPPLRKIPTRELTVEGKIIRKPNPVTKIVQLVPPSTPSGDPTRFVKIGASPPPPLTIMGQQAEGVVKPPQKEISSVDIAKYLGSITIPKPRKLHKHLQYLFERRGRPKVQVTITNQTLARLRCHGYEHITTMAVLGKKLT